MLRDKILMAVRGCAGGYRRHYARTPLKLPPLNALRMPSRHRDICSSFASIAAAVFRLKDISRRLQMMPATMSPFGTARARFGFIASRYADGARYELICVGEHAMMRVSPSISRSPIFMRRCREGTGVPFVYVGRMMAMSCC